MYVVHIVLFPTTADITYEITYNDGQVEVDQTSQSVLPFTLVWLWLNENMNWKKRIPNMSLFPAL